MVALGAFKKGVAPCLLALVCAGVSAAQEGGKGGAAQPRPDLSWAWVLEVKPSSDRSKQPAQGKTRLLIVHREPEIRISRVREVGGRRAVWESVHYTDGRGESNQMLVQTDAYSPEMAEEGITSKTVWKGEKLVVRSRMKALGRSFANVELVSEWRLSPDGRTLTETSRVTNNGAPLRQPDASDLRAPRPRPREIKRVYRRED